MSARIIIGADIVPTKSNIRLFENGDIETLIGDDLGIIFDQSDFIILNLETPLTDDLSPIKKYGPNFAVPQSTCVGLSKINPYFYTLANNHILDQGELGLLNTIETLDEYNIQYAGIGKNLSEIKHSYIRHINGVTLGIYCCAEHEFSIATRFTAGANPFDSLYSFDDVFELKQACDYCIVLYHGGKENYRYPTPELQRIFRKFATSGADLVIAQHTHCIGCMERYENSFLVYGQGNFLFDNESTRDNALWDTSLIIDIQIGEEADVSFIPLKRSVCGVRLAHGEEKEDIYRDFIKRSQQIKDEEFVEREFSKLAENLKFQYLRGLSAGLMKDKIFRILNRVSHDKLLEKVYANDNILALVNYLNCESHRELVCWILDNEKGTRN